MAEPAIVTTLLLFLAAGFTTRVALMVRQREQRAHRTREWIEYLQQDLVS